MAEWARFNWKDPHRARILARLARLRVRRRREHRRTACSFDEAHALMWDGKLERAIHVLDAHVIGRKSSSFVQKGALVVKLQAMLLDGQIIEAQKVFDANAATLEMAGGDDDNVEFIRALFEFHEDRLDSARVMLEGIIARARRITPMPYAARFFLAAIAHRQGRSDDSFALLTDVIRYGGDLVVARWAREQCENPAIFPNRVLPEGLRAHGPTPPPTPPPPPRRTKQLHLLKNLRRHLRVGLALLVLHVRPFRALAGYRPEQVVLLVLFNVLVAFGLHLVDYSGHNARFLGWQVLPIVGAPIVMLIVTAVAATFGRRNADAGQTMMNLLGGFYSVLPPFLVLASITAHVRTSSTIQWALEIAFAVWSLGVVLRTTHATLRREVNAFYVTRLLVVAAMFGVTFLLPMRATLNTRFWFTPPSPQDNDDDLLETNLPVVTAANAARAQEHDRLVFEQAERMIAKERELESGRPAFADLYFIGAAGWSDQDVFFREVTSARELMDRRFDTKGRSLILANDPTASGQPLASVVNLRHGIDAIGKRMNRDEDILFLFVTSHGDEKGLGFRFPEHAAYDSETLKPLALKSMLDDAHIKWRVLVISGCESGVFLEPLRSPTTLLVTAAAVDRPSYGCETGNAYTEFGRALFGDVLPQERSFSVAFQSAISKIEAREKKDGILPSRPQLAEGAEIGAKLHQFEARFGP